MIPRSAQFTYVYTYLFQVIGVKLPFSLFICQVLNVTDATPSQLHPNSWAYLRCFEIVAEYFRFGATARLFFFFYQVDTIKCKNKFGSAYISLSFDDNKYFN